MNKAAIPEPMPDNTKGEDVFAQVYKDLEARKQYGIKQYGSVLHTNNGRDALIDAYQEALDLAVYLCQAIMERDK